MPSLRDGTPVRVRALAAADRDRLIDAFSRLSPSSRYRRFLSPMRELSPHQLSRLVDAVDGVNHVALWLLTDDADERDIGIGRWVRNAGAPDSAEVAVTIADEWHGRGAAGLLMEELSRTARDRGVAFFTATVLGDNVASLKMLARVGKVVERRYVGAGLIDLVVELRAPAADSIASPP